MKRSSFVLVLLFGAALALIAEQYPEFITGMKVAARATDRLRGMDKKIGKDATGAAERIGGIYEDMLPFWRGREKPAAVKIVVEGKAAALALANAAHAGDADRAEAAFTTLSGTCKSCHETFREKLADGKYGFKETAPSH
jgi:cytochrome c553